MSIQNNQTSHGHNLQTNLCIHCNINPRWIDRAGNQTAFCSKACRDAATTQSITATPTSSTNANQQGSLCYHCNRNPRWVDGTGNLTPFCSRSCKAAAASQSMSPPTNSSAFNQQGNLCVQCNANPRWIDGAGNQTPFCSKACKATAASQSTTSPASANSMNGFHQQGAFCVQCQRNPKWVDSAGIQTPFCSRACKAAAGIQSTTSPTSPTTSPTGFSNFSNQNWNLCVQCQKNPKWVDASGNQTPFCSKVCKAAAASQGTSAPNNSGSNNLGSNNPGFNNNTATPMCKECGANPVFVTHHGVATKYCSRSCRAIGIGRKNNGITGNFEPPCIICGAHPRWVNPATGRLSQYCSKVCAKSGMEEKLCRTCGLNQCFSKDGQSSLYCSQECAATARQQGIGYLAQLNCNN